MSRTVDLDLTLDGVTPPISRRVRVKPTLTLGDLHRVIQAVMAWGDYHLHLYEVAGREYGPPDADQEQADEQPDDEATITIADALAATGGSFAYVYDFGDEWRLSIRATGESASAPAPYPECVAGERAAPPEDSGGPGRYQELLTQWMAGGRRGLSKEWRDWLPRRFDPMAFDVDAANVRLTEEFRGDVPRASVELSADDQLLADLTLLLLFLGSWVEKDGAHVSWKTMRFEMLDVLGDRGFLVTNTHRKSVVLTDLGVRRAEVLRARVADLLAGRAR